MLLYAGADYQKHANDEVICIAMIETAEGIEKLDEIASTPGLDAIYIGPTDLALALGLPPVMDNDEPKHIATVNRILESCKRHKIVAGIHTAAPSSPSATSTRASRWSCWAPTARRWRTT